MSQNTDPMRTAPAEVVLPARLATELVELLERLEVDTCGQLQRVADIPAAREFIAVVNLQTRTDT